MKPHLILKLKHPMQREIPSWVRFVSDKSVEVTRLGNQADQIFARSHLPLSITAEYQPQAQQWSADEVASGLNRIYRLILKDNTHIPDKVIQQVDLLPEVEYIRRGPVAVTELPAAQSHPLGRNTNNTSYPELQNIARLHQQYTDGTPDITIAVLDTGIYTGHKELKPVIKDGFDFVDIIDGASEFIGDATSSDEDFSDLWVGHGTHVAGIIAAQGLAMPPGVAPRCRILGVRVLGALKRGQEAVGAGLVDNINSGIKWAVDQGADIINMSLGIRHSGGGLPHEEVIEYARRKGVTIVAAAGNDGTENRYFPGANPYVIAVGATNERGEIAGFSTFGTHVSLVAPGTNIYSSYLHNEYAYSSGTSQASPCVAGAVALLKSYARKHGKKLSDKQIKYLLKHTSDKIDARFKHIKAGFGKLNLPDALKLLSYHLN